VKPQAWVARHAQTFVGSLGRIVREPGEALLTMTVIAVAFALPLLLDVLLQNTLAATQTWHQMFDVSVYLEKQAAPARTQALAGELKRRPDVAAVRIIRADEALAEFRNASGMGSALDALPDNPLPDTLVVTPTAGASTAQGTLALERAIAAAPGVHMVQVDTQWVARLDAILSLLRRILAFIAALLGIGVVLVIGNTVRLDIMNRRAEIEVMKLVGATDGFARRPFLYSGAWYGLGGGCLALLAVGLAVRGLSDPVDRLARAYASPFHLSGISVTLGAAVLGTAVALGWLGSWLAATRHIRRIEPL
jgi:cell division transport system permease protein